MNYYHALITQIGSLPPEIWQMLLAGVIASPVIQVLKKWLDAEKHYVELIIMVVSLIASFIIYSINTDPLLKNQLAAILAQMGILRLAATPFYLIFIKGLWSNVLAEYWGKGKELQEQLKSSLVPAEGLQLEAQGAVAPAQIADPTDSSDFGA